MARFKFTLLLYVSLVLAFATSSNANSFGHRRDHADLGRLLKKRTPLDVLGQPSQGGPSLSSVSVVQPTQPTSAAAQTTPIDSASVPTTSDAASPTPTSPSTSSGSSGSVISGSLSTSSATAPSPASVPPSATSSSPGAPQTSAQASEPAAGNPTQSVVYMTSNAPTPTQTSSPSSSGVSHAAMTVLVVIAAIVGAAIIVWTIIRKWKFRPSSDFEGRMQPIDWQPGGSDNDSGFPSQHRPLSRASSFHSGSGHGLADDQMQGPVGGYNASALNPIPDHDFTAGPAHLAPVGGYADLSRGPSPQPMMQESLTRAPSVNTPVQYDPYGVPLHHGYNGY